jgi:hypothetical protein
MKDDGSELRNMGTISNLVSPRFLLPSVRSTLCGDELSVKISKSKPSVRPKWGTAGAIANLSGTGQIKVIYEMVRTRGGEQQGLSQENSIFLFPLARLDVRFGIPLIHLEFHRFGSADSEFQKLWHQDNRSLRLKRFNWFDICVRGRRHRISVTLQRSVRASGSIKSPGSRLVSSAPFDGGIPRAANR